MTIFRTVLLLAAAFGGALSAQAQPGGAPAPALLAEEEFNRVGMTRAWWGHAVMNPKRDRLQYISGDERTLVAISSVGVVTAFDAETGRQLWYRQVGASDAASLRPSFDQRNVYCVSGRTLYALDRATGDETWALGLPSEPNSTPMVSGRQIYVGFLDGSQYAFDLERINEFHSAGKLPAYSAGTVVWRFRTSRPITAPAIARGKTVIFASGNGLVYCVSADKRDLVYQFETDAALTAPPIRYRDLLLLASEDYNVYSLQITNGRQRWQFTTGLVIRKAPVLIEDEVYLLPERGNLYKLDPATGAPFPEFPPKPNISEFLAASADRVFAIDQGGNLIIMSRQRGETLGRTPLKGLTLSLINDYSDRVYLASRTGLVICAREIGRDYPRLHKHPERQPLTPEFAPEGSIEPTVEEVSSPDEAAPQPESEPDATSTGEPEEPAEQSPADEEN
jgi:outer membrane protein assembly factor BamB